MTKRRLEQYSSIKAEVTELKAKIADREKSQLTDTVTGSSPEYPFTKHTVTIKGVDYGDDFLTQRLKEKEYLLDEECAYIEKWLDTVEDSKDRRILRKHYIDGESFLCIATSMGWRDEGAPRKRIEKYFR